MASDTKISDSDYAQLKTSTIMLVDDEPIMLEIVQALLEEEGYQNFIAIERSSQVIEKMIEANPDIMLLDLDMPEFDGFEVLEKVRTNEKFSHLPVVILTASEDPESKLKALELGATDFLSKPVDPSELALRVRNTLSAKAYQDQLAYYDSLTGLPNRKLFIERLAWAIQYAKRENKSLALLDVGLDRFREINDTLGFSAGDHTLQTIAERLLQVLRCSDIIGQNSAIEKMGNMARTGGDEFSLVLCGINAAENAAIVSERVLEAVRRPIVMGGDDLYLSASIGITICPDDGEDVEILFQQAGLAKDYAKKNGEGLYQYYSSEINAHAQALIKMESDIRVGLDKQEFELFYQPKIDISSGSVMGMEALIRWFHPEHGFISPLDFIPLAEEKGLINPIGEWVLNEACTKTSEWNADGYGDLKVSVNVSAKQFKDSGFKASVISALRSSGLNPHNLMLEITESVLMGDVEDYVNLMQEIRELGVSFSLDDFGTGYSSLSYLKRFPIGELKIDRSFLIEVPSNNEDCSIVKAIIAMAHSLGHKVVAEGVDNAEQLSFLKQHNCDIIQGYYFSKALNNTDFFGYLTQKKMCS